MSDKFAITNDAGELTYSSQSTARTSVQSPIAGIDGCRRGWLVALEAGDRGNGSISLEVIASAAELFTRWPDLSLAVIDIPIGLTERTPRKADTLARRYLGVRGCTVFPAPYRAMLSTAGQVPELGQIEASNIRRSLDGKGCSRQAYMIFDKIKDVDTVITPALQSKVVEGHPEVSFATMRGGTAMPNRKASAAGRAERLQALAPVFGDVSLFLATGRSLGVEADDVLDAFAMLWTARRLRDGVQTLRLPDPAEPVGANLCAQIVA